MEGQPNKKQGVIEKTVAMLNRRNEPLWGRADYRLECGGLLRQRRIEASSGAEPGECSKLSR
jgi:hypothetical protein